MEEQFKCCSDCIDDMTNWRTTEPSMRFPDGEICPVCDRKVPGLYRIRLEYIVNAVKKIRILEEEVFNEQ